MKRSTNRRRHRPEEVVAKLRQADEALAKGTPITGLRSPSGLSPAWLWDPRPVLGHQIPVPFNEGHVKRPFPVFSLNDAFPEHGLDLFSMQPCTTVAQPVDVCSRSGVHPLLAEAPDELLLAGRDRALLLSFARVLALHEFQPRLRLLHSWRRLGPRQGFMRMDAPGRLSRRVLSRALGLLGDGPWPRLFLGLPGRRWVMGRAGVSALAAQGRGLSRLAPSRVG